MAAEAGGGDRPRWWLRLPARLDRVGGNMGRQLRTRLRRGQLADADLYEELFELLLASDCGVPMTEILVSGLRERAAKGRLRSADQLLAALKEEMLAQLVGPARELSLSGSPCVWLVAGVNGSGKTTTIAKLAQRLQSQGITCLVAASDTFRAAAIDQLRRMVEPTGAEMVAHQVGADPAAVVFDAIAAARARGRDVVLVDTAGRLHTKDNLMQELRKIRRVVTGQIQDQPAEALLVLDAYVGANAIAQARAFGEVVGATGLVLTKLDGSARGGYVFQVERELGLPVKLVGLGEAATDIEDFDPVAYVDRLLSEDDADRSSG
ncbi:MAG TPA: signal recognition particle-docking protein FtsY [Candidatus Dormibacteraeota bacterium]|nr:signal recognition particle-docking protein FtsY [Candidatus Dormibacteraeota bacterium]